MNPQSKAALPELRHPMSWQTVSKIAGSRRVSSDYAQFFRSERKSVRFGIRSQTCSFKVHQLSWLEVEVRGGIGITLAHFQLLYWRYCLGGMTGERDDASKQVH